MNRDVVRRAALACVLFGPAPAVAQAVVALPHTTAATTLTAAVSEQAQITLPAAVSFNVTDVAAGTSSGRQAVSISNIVLASATRQLRLSIMATAASFSPPVAGAVTWSASDVSWTTPNGGPNAWINGTRTNGTLSSTAFTTVATCDPDVSSCSTTGLSFSLAAKPAVRRSGAHTLVVIWKIESIGS